jgi:hypothetical protein
MNIVIRPAGYVHNTRGRTKFLRELRDNIIAHMFYGSRQHRANRNRMNFLVDFTDAPLVNSFGLQCDSPLEFSEFVPFELRYPWVYAVGGQQNRSGLVRTCDDNDTNTDGCIYTTMQWCANIGSFANGGGTFIYPGSKISGVFEHELSHTLYYLNDEYLAARFQDELVGPPPQQFLTEPECRAYAVLRGWLPDDCYLNCNPAEQMCSPRQQWWSPELRPPITLTLEECRSYQVLHGLEDADFPCQNAFAGRFAIFGLDDLMTGSATDVEPGDYSTNLTHARQSFQRACELRVFDVLLDERLSP